MNLTSAQLTKLKNDINANATVIQTGSGPTAIMNIPNTPDTNVDIANWYNLTASPAWTVWRKNVTIVQIGDNINGGELAGLTANNQTRLQTIILLSDQGVNPSLADRRQFFSDIFSGAGGTITSAQLLALWKRIATNAQKLFSTGTGSDASPATTDSNVNDSFILTGADVTAARNS